MKPTQEVPTREKEILSFWKDKQIFAKSEQLTASGPCFVFYEGPPTANGKPGIHHILSRVYKDVYIRFYTQQGYHVLRKAGWDCHGLPVEQEVEKSLGIQTKAEIEQRYGIAKFNELCRKSVLRYISDWNAFSERMAFFVDLDNSYYTMDDGYIEVVWSLLKKIWDQGLIYQGYRVVPCDPVLGATMSDAEVDQGYREIEDPSLTVSFVLQDGHPFGDVSTSILVWTTTPWTLPANVALAIAPQEKYALIEEEESNSAAQKNQGKVTSSTRVRKRWICGLERLQDVFGPDYKRNGYRIINTFLGEKLIGLKYQRLFSFLEAEENSDVAWSILGADFVNMSSGSGCVHVAPAYGADDLSLGRKHKLPLLHGVGLDGKFLDGTPYQGSFFKDADKPIIKELKQRGLVWKSERYRHKYPFGYRTGAPLLYYAKNAWYICTTQIKDQLIKNNQSIRWVPEHIKNGRFGNWLENNRDWALSRERYWGTPLPIWTDGEGNFRLIESRQELSQLCGRDLTNLELHRPFVDEIEFREPQSGRMMRRIPEVIDCWFDSGAMPYAQWYDIPEGERSQSLGEYFPADFISEAIDQTRGWFYTLLCISSMVSSKSSYKNVVCLGHVLDKKGEKMSKSRGNVVDPWAIFDSYGADAIRWYFLTGSPPGNPRRIAKPGSHSSNDPLQVAHGFLNMFRNSVGFFNLYAEIDGICIEKNWQEAPIRGALAFAQRPDIDCWLLSLLQDVIATVTRCLENYDCLTAGKAIEDFLESLSNWYIRRNRRRFWKGDLDEDKLSAYDSLHRCLTSLSRLLVPFAPFIAEETYQSLVIQPLLDNKQEADQGIPESVLLAGWPLAKHDQDHYDAQSLQEGDTIKQAVFLGRAARMQSGLKVRQPLAKMYVYAEQSQGRQVIAKNQDILLEELNVKALEFIDDAASIIDYRVRPNLPRLGKRIGPQVRIVQEWLARQEITQVLKQLDQAKQVCISLENSHKNELCLEKEDFIIESISKEGTEVASGDGIFVGLETRLTDELIAEGLVRDIVRNIQELRKVSGFAVTDHIGLYFAQVGGAKVDAPVPIKGKLAGAIRSFANYIEVETLGSISSQFPQNIDAVKKLDLDQQESLEIVLWKK